ncbi:unnamed protein product [Lampetra planeri]
MFNFRQYYSNLGTTDECSSMTRLVVVVVTVIVILCLLGVVLSYFLRHKGTYRTQEGKFQPGHGQGTALQAVEDNCEGLEENMKEYFL